MEHDDDNDFAVYQSTATERTHRQLLPSDSPPNTPTLPYSTPTAFFDPQSYVQERPDAFHMPDNFGMQRWPGTTGLGYPLANHFVPTPTPDEHPDCHRRIRLLEMTCAELASDLRSAISRLRMLEFTRGVTDIATDGLPTSDFSTVSPTIAEQCHIDRLVLSRPITSSDTPATSDSSDDFSDAPAHLPPPIEFDSPTSLAGTFTVNKTLTEINYDPPDGLQVGSKVGLTDIGCLVYEGYDWSSDPLTPTVNGTVVSMDLPARSVRVSSDHPGRAAANYDPTLLQILPNDTPHFDADMPTDMPTDVPADVPADVPPDVSCDSTDSTPEQTSSTPPRRRRRHFICHNNRCEQKGKHLTKDCPLSQASRSEKSSSDSDRPRDRFRARPHRPHFRLNSDDNKHPPMPPTPISMFPYRREPGLCAHCGLSNHTRLHYSAGQQVGSSAPVCKIPSTCISKGCPSAPQISRLPPGRVNPYTQSPTHIFVCTTCRDKLNLSSAFDGTYTNRIGPTPLPTNPPNPSSTDAIRPTCTIISPAEKPLIPSSTTLTSDGLQQTYTFGDVSLILAHNVNRGLHVTGTDGTMYQRHEIFSPNADADAVRARMRALSKTEHTAQQF
jgi:hypothetical protein